MTIYAWPVTAPGNPVSPFWPKAFDIDFTTVTAGNASSFNGAQQDLIVPGTTWKFGLTFDRHNYANRTKLGSFLRKLNVQEHRVQLFNFANPVPAGTLNLSGIQVASAASTFATSLSLKNGTVGSTLLAGDMFNVPTSYGTQLLEVVEDVTVPFGGFFTVYFRQMLRGDVATNAAVNFTRPTALFVMEQKTAVPYAEQGVCPEFGVTFTEVFA